MALRLQTAMERRLAGSQGALATLAGRLDVLSPLRTLERGYAIAFAEKSGRAVHSAAEVAPGDRLRLRFAAGEARAIVEEVDPCADC
jgi:exodeoxyribonuclease VII large subunit